MLDNQAAVLAEYLSKTTASLKVAAERLTQDSGRLGRGDERLTAAREPLLLKAICHAIAVYSVP